MCNLLVFAFVVAASELPQLILSPSKVEACRVIDTDILLSLDRDCIDNDFFIGLLMILLHFHRDKLNCS